MIRPVLWDLCSGAGGAGKGYHDAGFDVIGVDNRPQPRYPFMFYQADAMQVLADLAAGLCPLPGPRPQVVHISPPCQDHSPLRSRAGEHGTGWMLAAALTALAGQAALWVVENVGSAHNRADFLLCGETFGLRTVRHRKFTIDPRYDRLLAVPPHPRHRRRTSTKNRVAALAAGDNLSVTGNIGVHAGPPCMGIDWMNGQELSQAIPPAYTEFIGRQLIEAV